ncbi:MAG: hypothetical protein ACI9FN_002673 [Saprospiraceae bacterium]|jgi:hypothetical protein
MLMMPTWGNLKETYCNPSRRRLINWRNIKGAFKNNLLCTIQKDSIINNGTTDRIASLNVAFETEKNQNQISLRNTKNELFQNILNAAGLKIYDVGIGLFIFGLFIFGLFSFFMNYTPKLNIKIVLSLSYY